MTCLPSQPHTKSHRVILDSSVSPTHLQPIRDRPGFPSAPLQTLPEPRLPASLPCSLCRDYSITFAGAGQRGPQHQEGPSHGGQRGLAGAEEEPSLPRPLARAPPPPPFCRCPPGPQVLRPAPQRPSPEPSLLPALGLSWATEDSRACPPGFLSQPWVAGGRGRGSWGPRGAATGQPPPQPPAPMQPFALTGPRGRPLGSPPGASGARSAGSRRRRGDRPRTPEPRGGRGQRPERTCV